MSYRLQVTGYRLRVYWLAGLMVLLVGCGGQPSAVSVQQLTSTVDPFVALANEQATNEASEQKIELLSGQLTATAEAPIVAITQTAAAFEMQVMFSQATAQSISATETVAVTQTAMYWTATPNATSTMVAAQVMAESTKIANDTEINNLMVERARVTNTLRAMAGYIVGFIFLLGAMMLIIVLSKRLSFVPTAIHESGKPHPMLNVIDAVVSDVDRLANGTGSLTSGFLKQLPAITAERQDAVTNRAQLVDMQTRRGKLPRRLLENQSREALPAPTVLDDDNVDFPLPSWHEFSSFNFRAGGELLFGKYSSDFATVDINRNPHKAVIGPSGTGKSRLFIRPFLASALASGNYVIAIGEMVDLAIFGTHPNATLVPVNDVTTESGARQYVDALRVILVEMNKRFEQLTMQNISTWEHAGGANTLLALDELGVAIELLEDSNPQYARSAKAILSALIKKGRKAGFNFLFSSQRAVGLKNLLSQVDTFVFRVKTEDEERFALGKAGFGATQLDDGYFLSNVGKHIRVTGAFHPSDADLGNFLIAHGRNQIEKPKWIEGVVSAGVGKQIEAVDEARSLPEAEQLTVGGGQWTVVSHQKAESSQPKFDADIVAKAEELRPHYHVGMKKSKIAEILYQRAYGGDLAWKIGQILEYLSTTTSTTTENKAEIGNLEALPA